MTPRRAETDLIWTSAVDWLVKRCSASLGVVLIASTSALAAQPFDGRWYLACGAKVGDIVPTVIDSGTIVRYESECEITETEPIGAREQAWRVTATCAGEGETWIEHMIIGLDFDVDRKPRQLIAIDMDEGFVLTYRTCD